MNHYTAQMMDEIEDPNGRSVEDDFDIVELSNGKFAVIRFSDLVGAI